MKNTSKVIQKIAGLIVMAAIGFAVLSMTIYPTLNKGGNNNQTPTADDFTTSGIGTVTFDVEEAEGFNAANGLSAGTLTINKSGGCSSSGGSNNIGGNRLHIIKFARISDIN